ARGDLDRTVVAAATHRAKQRHRVGKRVLLAVEARDEAAPADVTAQLEPAQRAHDVAPRHGHAVARDDPAEYDAGALEEARAERHLVEPGGMVVLDAKLQDPALPESRRRLDAREATRHLGDALRAEPAALLVGELPRGEEAQEVGGRDRLDLLAQPLDGVALH